jgi:hypothetical protein
MKRKTKEPSVPTDPPPTAAAPPSARPDRVFISIDNFDRMSKSVYFTEPATVEAIRRLGFSPTEFSYRSEKDFAAEAPDPKVAQLLQSRWEARRTFLIEKVGTMRASILREPDDPRPLPVVLRKEQMMIEQTKQTIRQMEMESNVALKKIAMARMHDIARHAEKVARSARVSAHIQALAEAHAELLQKAKQRKPFPKPAERVFDTLTIEEFRASMAAHLARAEGHLRSVREKWARAGLKIKRETALARERNRNFSEEQLGARMRTIERHQQRFAEWKHQHEEYMTGVIEGARARINVERDALGARDAKDQERRKMILAELEERQKKFAEQCAKYEKEMRDRWQQKGREIKRNGAHARTAREALYQEDWARRKAWVDKKRDGFLEREAALKEAEVIDLTTRQIDRDERASNARHFLASADYAAKRRGKQMKDDLSAAPQLAQEREEVVKQRGGARIRLTQARKRLERELKGIQALDDQEALKGVKRVLGIDDAQITELVESARKPTGAVEPQRKLRADDE